MFLISSPKHSKNIDVINEYLRIFTNIKAWSHEFSFYVVPLTDCHEQLIDWLIDWLIILLNIDCMLY